MDPTQTLSDLLYLLRQGEIDRDNCIYALTELSEWLEKGGFMPDVHLAVRNHLRTEDYSNVDKLVLAECALQSASIDTDNERQVVLYTYIYEDEDGNVIEDGS